MHLLFSLHHNKVLRAVGLSFLLALVAQLSPRNTSAAECDPATNFCNPIDADNFFELVTAIATAITAIGIPLVAIFLIWSGFLFVTARGNEEQLKRAKTTFFWALVGGAVVIGARVLAIAIVNFAKGLG